MHTVRVINITSGIISNYAGQPDTPGSSGDGLFLSASMFTNPHGLALDKPNNLLYIADNYRVRVVNRTSGIIDAFAGYEGGGCGINDGPKIATSVLLGCGQKAIAVDSFNNRVFISDLRMFW
jgi:DNA-binding beta-propeller fold protein YncE